MTGLLVEPGNATALRAGIERLLGDPQLRDSLGAAARVRFERHFAADVVIDRIEALYGELDRLSLAKSSG